jgi:hypothetical protein
MIPEASPDSPQHRPHRLDRAAVDAVYQTPPPAFAPPVPLSMIVTEAIEKPFDRNRSARKTWMSADALAVIRYAKRYSTKRRPRLTALLARRPTKVAAIQGRALHGTRRTGGRKERPEREAGKR